jgi:MFS family permease
MQKPTLNYSRLGLNVLNFFAAAIQAGFGPFIAVWLTMQGWQLSALGLALSVGTFAALVSQLPGGVLVDALHNKRVPTAGALIGLGISALMLCLPATLPVVWGAQIGHALASSILTPAIAALTLTLCGHDSFGERLGVNTRYASLGNAASAALLGLTAAAVSEQAVFLATASLVIPAIVALFMIRAADDVDTSTDHPALLHPRDRQHLPWHIFAEPSLHVFAASVVLFQLANAALLPLAMSELTQHHAAPGYIVSAVIIVPQVITAIIAPAVGRLAHRIGRRPVLLVGFTAVPARALLFATIPSLATVLPSGILLAVFQSLDAVGAAVLGLMLPLIAADLTRRTGFLNFAIGSLGLASGLGGTLSTALAGWCAQHVGEVRTDLILAAIGGLPVVLMALLMPETRPTRTRPAPEGAQLA